MTQGVFQHVGDKTLNWELNASLTSFLHAQLSFPASFQCTRNAEAWHDSCRHAKSYKYPCY